MFALGKYVVNKNEFFRNNSFALFVIGSIIYLSISFVLFLPFVWLSVNKKFLVVVFFVKDFIIASFIIYHRESIFKQINYLEIFWIAVGSISVWLIWIYGITDTRKLVNVKLAKTSTSTSSLNLWQELKNTFTTINKQAFSLKIMEKFSFSLIASAVSYSVVMSIFKTYVRGNGLIERILSIGITILIFFLIKLNYSIQISNSIGVMLILFSIFVGIRLITYSRRRYAAVLGMISFVSWFIQNSLFSLIAIVMMIIIVLYSYHSRPKPSLFFVQLLSPIIMILSLKIYKFHHLLSLALFILSIIFYIFIFFIGKNTVMEKLNVFLIQHKISFVFGVVLTIWTIMIISMLIKSEWKPPEKFITFNNPIFFRIQISWVNILQSILYWALFSSLFGMIIYWQKKDVEFTFNKYLILIGTLTIVFAYNPLIESSIYKTFLDKEFIYIALIPVFSGILSTSVYSLNRFRRND